MQQKEIFRRVRYAGPSSPSLCVCWESMLNNNDSRDNSENSERAGIVSGSWENNQLFLLSLSTNICATCAAGNRVCNICLPGQAHLPRGNAHTVATELQHIVAIASLMLQLLSISQSGIKTAKEAESEKRKEQKEMKERGKKGCEDGGIFNQLAYHAHLGRPLSLHLNLCLCKSKLLPMAHFACLSCPLLLLHSSLLLILLRFVSNLSTIFSTSAFHQRQRQR